MKAQKLFIAMTMAASMAVAAPAEDHKEKGHHGHEAAATDTLTGEVVDLSCFLAHNGQGKEHKQCARQCIQKGLPVGLLTGSGEVYLAVSPNHKKANDILADKAADTITVVGKVSEKTGMKMITIDRIVKK